MNPWLTRFVRCSYMTLKGVQSCSTIDQKVRRSTPSEPQKALSLFSLSLYFFKCEEEDEKAMTGCVRGCKGVQRRSFAFIAP
jgi:hypothetical protein